MIIIVIYSAMTGSARNIFSGFQGFEGNEERTWLSTVPAFDQLILNGALYRGMGQCNPNGFEKKQILRVPLPVLY